MRRTHCGACGHDDLEMFLDLGVSPIADAYMDRPNEPAQMYPLQLAVCTGCWLVQLLEIVDHEILFGTGYSFYSSASPPLSSYHGDYAARVLRRHLALAERLTVEIGCNDGDMLRHFEAAGCKVIGVDPASGPVKVARSRGLNVYEVPFGRVTAEEIVDQHGHAGIVIANHVLAHVESVSDVLDGIQRLLAADGVAYIEVQYLPDLLVNNAFDLVYHEHRNFFSLTSLENAAARWDLHVVGAQLTDRQGGSLRVMLTRAEPTGRAGLNFIRRPESWLRGVETYRGFQGRADRIRDRLVDLIYGRFDGRIIGYGAPAKATTLLNFCGLTGRPSVVVDTTEAKQGRYIPGTIARIEAPADVDLSEAEALLLLAWNYAPEIMRNHLDYTQAGGRWIVPIPAPVIL
jgi:SAM-dependent methyltransferase